MTKFEELVAKLSELFELDKADLDFGIHRIVKTKHDQIATYLKERLPEKVKTVLGELRQAETSKSLAELRREVVDKLGADAFLADDVLEPLYVKTPLGERYNAAAEAARNIKRGEQTEAEVYSHLYEFFSRYYEEGDFISRRRRTAGRETYAIPYDGEEVVLHWANKDQYYVKSSEDLKDYTFTVLLNASGDKGRVQFKLTRMDAVQNNNKASRIFQLDSEAEIQAGDESLVIPFHFAEGKSRNQTDELAWENSILAALPVEWQARLAAKDDSYTGNGERSILQKHLRNYTKKNTSDYFIHKDLGGFLRRELDFYIKNEVMYLDDVDNRPADYLERELRKIKAIRAVAHDLIAFLAQFEDFQKRLWLKKKFVVETNWCITLDRIPEALYPEIAANDAQREEWVHLFAIDEIEAVPGELLTSATPGYSEPLTVEFLKANDKLVLDTAFFPAEFKARLLASIDDIDAQTDGLLIHSENFQALNLMLKRFQEQIKCIYIDPPYNTGQDDFLYKDQYQRSSWLAFISERIRLGRELLSDKGLFFSSIDFLEESRLREVSDQIFSPENFLAKVIWEKRFTRSNNAKLFSTLTENVLAYRKGEKTDLLREPRSEKADSTYGNPDNDPRGIWTSVSYVNPATKEARPNLSYPLMNPITGEAVVHPTNAWKYEQETYQKHVAENRLYWGPDGGHTYPRLKKFLSEMEGMVPVDLWKHEDTGTTDAASKLLEDEFGSKVFEFPKPPSLMKRIAGLAGFGTSDGVFLDFFAGTAPTAHAVISLNREDEGARKFILVEMADYFDTVTKPRVQKVVYSAGWKDGKPTSRDTGVSHCFKYLRLESYEDTLNNLALEDRSADLLGLSEQVQDDYLLHYSLDVESRANLLDLTRFENPFACTLKIYNRASGEAEPRLIDLPETFNYLLGLRVRTTQMRDGFLVIKGENPTAETVLVIWRNVQEKDNAALETFITGTLGINPAETEYAAIYINGDTTLDDPHGKILLTEQVFYELMFDVREL